MTTESRPPGAESSVAIIIDGSTMYEPGITAGSGGGGVTIKSQTAVVTDGTTSTSGGLAAKITQAPVLAGGAAALAWMAM